MHRKVIVVACVACLCACPRISGPDLFSCEPPEFSPPRMDIGPAELVTIAVGESLQLTAVVRPVSGGMMDLESGCNPLYGEAVPAVIHWFSSDPRIATVSATGVVMGLAPGSAIVRAHAPFRFASTSLRVSVRD